jgi:ABC-type multidrug transport system ATPase subunit
LTLAIRTQGLTKRYGSLTVVVDLGLEVGEGDVFGFLGPNGSGKTTTIRMLLGLVHPTTGAIELLGEAMPKQAHRVLPHVGALVEGPGFYPNMSGRRNLAVFDAAGVPRSSRSDRTRRIEEALVRVGLGGIDQRSVRAFSMGMRQRLGLAAALMRRPRLLVLDEPTNGLDPQGIHEVSAILTELAAGGTTVFLSSHLLGEVESICTRAAMMAGGRLVAQDRIERLLAPTGRIIIDTPDGDRCAAVLAHLHRGASVDRDAERFIVGVDGWAPEHLNYHLVHAGVRVRGLQVERRTLVDTYLHLTGETSDARR